MWQMVRNGQMPAKQFVELVMRHARKENDPSLLDSLCSQLRAAVQYMRAADRSEMNSKIVHFLFAQLQEAVEGSNAQESFFNALMGFSIPSDYFPTLVSWLQGDLANYLRGFELHQDRRWKVIITLARSGYSEIGSLLASEESKDLSDRGRISSKAAQTAIPDQMQKAEWFKNLATPKAFVASDTAIIAAEFHHPLRAELTAFSTGQFLDSILELSQKDLDRKTGHFIRRTYPVGISRDFDATVVSFVNQNQDKVSVLIQRALLEKAEDSEKVIGAREK